MIEKKVSVELVNVMKSALIFHIDQTYWKESKDRSELKKSWNFEEVPIRKVTEKAKLFLENKGLIAVKTAKERKVLSILIKSFCKR